jgi:hypothetical protein
LKSANQEIYAYASNSSAMAKYYHSENWKSPLRRFLHSTMDEVRLKYAAELSAATLQLYDVVDAEHFRHGVLRREASGDIAYPKQRDHSAHTVNNWLLGWYIYERCAPIREELQKHFALRELIKNEHQSSSMFGDQWQFVSLLHDLGYIFEGALTALDAGQGNRQALSGMAILREYFNHRRWVEMGFSASEQRADILRMSNVDQPNLGADSMPAIADALRTIGSLEVLRAQLLADLKGSKKEADFLAAEGGLPSDSFLLWKAHFDYYGLSGMSARVDAMEKTFYANIYQGVEGGIRLLDHGICSGLMLLMFSTSYFRIHFGLEVAKPANPREVILRDRFLGNSSSDYSAAYWWRGILWSTAAAALHNVQQSWPRFLGGAAGPLSLEEDPLTWLGVLVDILQEWDRYTISRSSFLGGSSATQGVDVGLEAKGNEIVVQFEDQRTADKAVRDLDKALADWKKYALVQVGSLHPD